MHAETSAKRSNWRAPSMRQDLRWTIRRIFTSVTPNSTDCRSFLRMVDRSINSEWREAVQANSMGLLACGWILDTAFTPLIARTNGWDYSQFRKSPPVRVYKRGHVWFTIPGKKRIFTSRQTH